MSRHRCRITDDWLPAPAAALKELGWRNNDVIEWEIVGDSVVLTRPDPQPAPPNLPPKVKL